MYDELLIGLRGHAKRKGCDDRCPCYDAVKRGYATCSEELAEKAADAIEELNLIAESNRRSSSTWADTAAAAVEQIPRWIPVTERLPEEDCQVLAYYGFNHGDGDLGMMFMQVMDYYARDPKPHFRHEGLNGLTVTHWQPLPELPKEEA